MSIETGPPDNSYDDNVEWLIDSLPGFMENDETSGNWKLFSPIGDRLDELEDDLQSVSRATFVQEANTIEQLEKHAQAVNLPYRQGETLEHYRARIFAKYQLNTSEGTAGDVINSVSTILNTDPENIGYKELNIEATIRILMPSKKVDNLNLAAGEIANILNNLVPAGYDVRGKLRGSFKYVTPSTYNDTTNWSEYEFGGYDGLDSNGDPKEDGGTYAGILT
jgi:hypothetical protein